MAAFVSVVALLVLASAAFALSNEQWRNDLEDVGGVSHRSQGRLHQAGVPVHRLYRLSEIRRSRASRGRLRRVLWAVETPRDQIPEVTGTKWKSVRTKGRTALGTARANPTTSTTRPSATTWTCTAGRWSDSAYNTKRLRIVGDHSAWLKVGGRWNDHFLE